MRANCCHSVSILVHDSCKQICCKWKKTAENIPDFVFYEYGNIFFNRESLNLPVILGSVLFVFFWFLFFGFRYMERIERRIYGPRTVKSFHTWIRFGGKDRPGFVWIKRIDVTSRKARKYISKIEKNKDDKNDNKNNLTVWDTLGWVNEKSPVCHNLHDFKQYNFYNCSVTLQKLLYPSACRLILVYPVF